jgi:Ca2+-transporting ATPase
MALRGESENTPLQIKLNHLAEVIAKIGSAAGLMLFTALMIKFFVQLRTIPNRTASAKAQSFTQILIISVTLIVVAVPEGLPLAVTLALAFATKRMTKEQLLVRVLSSCEIMANSTVVCTDKTGTLTQNVMTVVAGSLGVHAKFVRQLENHQNRTNANEESGAGGASGSTSTARGDFSIDQSRLNDITPEPLRRLFSDAININSTAFEDKNPETGKLEFVGSKTESALLRFNNELGWRDYKESRETAEIVQAVPFSSERKSMGSVIKISEKRYRIYLKGASEILTKLCTKHVLVRPPGSTESSAVRETDEVETVAINSAARENISRTIIFYANQTLRTIALCYRDFESWPPAGMKVVDGQVAYEDLTKDLTLIAITGIEDPLRLGVTQAVEDCHTAGVAVKMCTGDNILTARSIATQCGIYTAGGIIMEGPSFRQLNDRDRFEVVPRLQVLARSSPEDKKILVDTLKKLGEVVGVTGDGANDAPALSHANVGFSMGIAGTEVAKEASDIVMMDDNFASIVSAIIWGRCVNDSVRKFLQFQISVNITAVITTFVTAVASDKEESVLTAVQLLWINIIMDTFAALALATDPASRALLNRKPDRKTAPLFTIPMTKQILGQSTYQCIIILIFHFAGNAIFGYKNLSEVQAQKAKAQLNTLVFNAFVFCQIFNSINCRTITNDLNVFRGIWKNWYFITITLLEIAVQIIIVFVGGAAFQVTRINGRDWGISIALGIAALPIGALIRLIPDEPVERLLVKLRIMKDPKAILPTQSPESSEKVEWNPAIEKVVDNLTTFSNIRGGRVRGSSFVRKSRTAQLHDADIQLPSLLAMVPTLVATTIGAGWAPQSGGSLSDPAGADPSKSSAALYAGSVQIHPETDPNDPFLQKWGVERTDR